MEETAKQTTTKRLMIKTAAITFLSLLFVLIITVSFYMLTFTASAGDFFSNTFSWYGLGSRLSYAAYDKDDDSDINLIAAAAERAIIHYNKVRTASANKYVYEFTIELFSHIDYDEYVAWQNQKEIALIGADANYDYFIKGNFFAAAYRRADSKSERLEAISQTRDEMNLNSKNTYGVNNPMSYVSRAVAAGKAEDEVVAAILDFYEELYSVVTDSVRKHNLCVDALSIVTAHGNAEQIELWQKRV